MKKLLMLLVFITSFGLVAGAQTKAGLTGQQKADRATKTLQKQLNLTADQATKINAIYASRAVQMDSVKLHPGVKGNGKRKKAITEETQAKINAVLTPAQQQQFAQWKAAKKQKMQANRKARRDSIVKS